MDSLISLNHLKLEASYSRKTKMEVKDLEKRSLVVNCFVKLLIQDGQVMLMMFLGLCFDCEYLRHELKIIKIKTNSYDFK